MFLFLVALTAGAAERTVNVSGTCTRATVPDRASITITADVTEKDVKSAMSKAAKQAEAVKYQVKIVGLPDLEMESTEAGANEDVDYSGGKRKSRGFRARVGVRYSTSDFSKLGRVIELAAKEQVHDIGALQTFLSEKKTRSEYEACLAEAAQNARTKAETLAKSLNAKLGDIVTLTEAGGAAPHPMPMAKSMMAADAAPVIEPGRATITVNVNATFQLK